MITIEGLYAQAGFLGITVEETRLPSKCQAVYSDVLKLITIDETMNHRQKLCSLQHELIHARHHDMKCQGEAQTREERRTRRETALALISPSEYALAEGMYDGAIWPMAVELGVTKQVLKDYMKLLGEYGEACSWRHDYHEVAFVGA